MKLFKNYFSILTILFVIAGFLIIMVYPKGTLELIINQKLTKPALDIFFKYFTYLGDGLMLLILFIVFLFVKYRYCLMVIATALFQTLLIHINKQFLFSGMPRPKVFLENYDLYFVEGVNVHGYNSFPSGHTATAFSIFFLLSIIVENKGLSVLFFVLAIIIGFSRIYLMQHFFADVYAGAIIGYISTLLAYYVAVNYGKSPKFEKRLIT